MKAYPLQLEYCMQSADSHPSFIQLHAARTLIFYLRYISTCTKAHPTKVRILLPEAFATADASGKRSKSKLIARHL